MVQRLIMAALAVGLLAMPSVAQETKFDSSEALYAVYELSEGGRPLYEKLFAKGWPTDEGYRRMTQDLAAENAELLIAVYLASGRAGLRLSSSDYELARMERLVFVSPPQPLPG